MDVIDALDAAYQHAGTVVAGVSTEQLAQASPCAEWDVRAVLDHMLGATWMFTLVNRGEAVGEEGDDLVGTDPRGALANAAAANMASWRAPGAFDGDRAYPFGTFPAPAAALLNLEEVVVHTWDIAEGTGQDTTIEPAIAEIVCGFLGEIPLDAYREHGAFGSEVAVASDASVERRLLALLGRTPS